jgi:DNA-binding NarL/FixJ family response regulator
VSAKRILVVEDNGVFRETLQLLLGMQEGLEVVGAVERGTDAAGAARRLEPDVVLMDYRLPGMDGVEATAAVLKAVPDTRVVCLTASATGTELDALREAGAVACLRKDQPLEEIVAAIRQAAA